MTKQPQNQWLAPVFFGSLWGLSEATFGYFFHSLSQLLMVPGLAGLFMFPIGFFFMQRSFSATGNYGTILHTGLVASAIKLTNLSLPFLAPWGTINPAMAILLESVAVYGLLNLTPELKGVRGITSILLVTVGWKVVFLFVQSSTFLIGMASTSGKTVMGFLVVDSLVNTALIAGIAMLERRFLPKFERLRPAFSLLLLFAAVSGNMLVTLAQHGSY